MHFNPNPLRLKNKPFGLVWIFIICSCLQTGFSQSPIDSLITVSQLKEVVYHLAADSLLGRGFNSPGCDSAAAFIAGKMEAAGLKKIQGLSGYYDDCGEAFQGVRNVIGILPGTGQKDEVVVISAHYDHLGVTEKWKPKTKRDEIFNGANDDASGVAVMLSLAGYYSQMPHRRSIIFIAFSGEEVGMWGSRALSAVITPGLVVAQINLEMLGRTGKHKQPFITGDSYSSVRNLLNQAISDSLHQYQYFEKDDGASGLFMRSDNFPLAQLGIPAHTIMLTTDLDPYYHTVKDEASTLDYINMCDITKHIALAITPLLNGLVTPNRINKNSLPKPFF